MAANLTDDADRLLRIQSWREKAVSHDFSHNVGQPNRIATQLCLECITFYRRCLRELSQNDRLTKPTFTRLSRNFETLALWAHGYNIAHGGLDEALLSSRRARRCYFEPLTSLCSTLLSRLPRCCSISELDDEARSLKRTLDAGIICLEDTYQDGDSTASSRSSRLASDDSIDEVINDLEVDVDGLIAMDSLITCPADRRGEPMTTALTAWAPHRAICERVANRFPMAMESAVERLGRATWDSFLRCKELRERSQMSNHDEESPEIVENTPALPAKTVTTSARSKDSGLGSSLPTSYAETIMSYQRQGGESVKVPPLPKSAADGVPFDCIVCGRNIVARTNSAWKNHLFNDLQPYICTFEACSRATPFESRQMWVNHTMNHVLDMPGPLDFDSAAVKCPLCLEDMRPGDAKHLAAHLEEIALGAVTLHADVDSDRGSAATDEEEGYEESNFSRDSAAVIERVKKIKRHFEEQLLPLCFEFLANPPSDPTAREKRFDELHGQVTVQTLRKLDYIAAKVDVQAKRMWADLVNDAVKVISEMNPRISAIKIGGSRGIRDQRIPASTAAHDSVREEQVADVQSDVTTRTSSGESDSNDDDNYQEFPAQERRGAEAYTAYKDTPCRNLLIYGHCRYKGQGCAFNHDTGNKGASPPNPFNQKQQQTSKQARSGGIGPSTSTEGIGSDTDGEDPKLRSLEAQGKRPLERMQKEAGVESDSGMEDPEFSGSWAQPPWSSAVTQSRGTDRGTSNKEGRDERREESIAWLCCACLSGPCNIIDPLCRNENCQHVRCETCRMTPLTYPGLPTYEQEAKVLAAVDKNGYLVTELGSRYAGERDEVLHNVGRDNQNVQALEQAFAANPQLSEKDIEEIAKQRGIDIPRVTRWFQSRVSLEESKKKTVLANSEEVASKVLMWSAMASVPVPDPSKQPINSTDPVEEPVGRTPWANPNDPKPGAQPLATSRMHEKDPGSGTKASLQALELEQEFSKNPKPSITVKQQIANKLGLDLTGVHNWFQKRREQTAGADEDQERLRGRFDRPDLQPDGNAVSEATTIMNRTARGEFIPSEASKRDSHQRYQSPPRSKEKYHPEDLERLRGRFDSPVQPADNYPALIDNARGKRGARVEPLSREQVANARVVGRSWGACDECKRRKRRCTHRGPLQASSPAAGIAQLRMRPDAEHQPAANLLVDVGSSDEKTLRSEASEDGSYQQHQSPGRSPREDQQQPKAQSVNIPPIPARGHRISPHSPRLNATIPSSAHTFQTTTAPLSPSARTFECSMTSCGKIFNRYADLERHWIFVHDRKPSTSYLPNTARPLGHQEAAQQAQEPPGSPMFYPRDARSPNPPVSAWPVTGRKRGRPSKADKEARAQAAAPPPLPKHPSIVVDVLERLPEATKVYPLPSLPSINEALSDLNPIVLYPPPPPAYDPSSGWGPSQD